ncbi:TPA: hypothetical protein JDL67_005129 [Salmonella enterica subsp. salamae]|nr:hypothetical protein [Salmonella enterica subsp. salamae]
MNKVVSTPLYLQRKAEGLLDELQDIARYPGTLRRILKNGRLTPAIPHDNNTIWRTSLTLWHEWLHHEKNHICFYYPKLKQRYCSYPRHIPEMDNLFSQTETANYPIDITDITGMSASHDPDCNVSDMDEFAVLCCQKQIHPVTPSHLEDNMSHRELRLTEMNFERCSWKPERLYWDNCGGSHHLAAARYQAKMLGIKIPARRMILLTAGRLRTTTDSNENIYTQRKAPTVSQPCVDGMSPSQFWRAA